MTEIHYICIYSFCPRGVCRIHPPKKTNGGVCRVSNPSKEQKISRKPDTTKKKEDAPRQKPGASCIKIKLYKYLKFRLYYALSHHSLCHFHESSYIRSLHIIHITILFCSILHAVLMDILHDCMQTVVNLLSSP